MGSSAPRGGKVRLASPWHERISGTQSIEGNVSGIVSGIVSGQGVGMGMGGEEGGVFGVCMVTC